MNKKIKIMNKKEDLKLVFDFIAEYLKSEKEQPKDVEPKELLIEDEKPKFNPSILDKLKTPVDSIGGDAAHIKDLMDRVTAKTVEQANVNNLLSVQRKEFEQEIKKLKENISNELKTEKLNEEGIIVSGDTVNMITENGVEKVIVDNGVSKSSFERKVKK